MDIDKLLYVPFYRLGAVVWRVVHWHDRGGPYGEHGQRVAGFLARLHYFSSASLYVLLVPERP